MIKKIFALLLVLGILFCMAGCGKFSRCGNCGDFCMEEDMQPHPYTVQMMLICEDCYEDVMRQNP